MPHSWYIWKALMSKGALTWFETIWSYGVEAIDYCTIFSMRINFFKKKVILQFGDILGVIGNPLAS
jgi:hypothetical protein